MLLTVHNHTSEPLQFASPSKFDPKSTEEQLVPAAHVAQLHLKRRARALVIRRVRPGAAGAWDVGADDRAVELALVFSASWQAIRVPADCPFLAYRLRITRTHHALLIIRRRDPATFLSDIPDSVRLSALLLPGTHQTMAFKGWPIAQCQSSSTPLLTQLMTGVRVLDIRIGFKDGVLVTYHDILPFGHPFATILADLRTFLTGPGARETVVMSIKQEDWRAVDAHVFSAAVRADMAAAPGGLGSWYLANRVPALGEVRGKAVLFSRFGADGSEWERALDGLGIHPLSWPDSRPEGFEWRCGDTLVRVHDWYRVPTFLSIPEKLARATRVLLPREGEKAGDWENGAPPALALTFLSASAIPLALPPTIARGFGWPALGLGVEGVNARFVRWLLQHLAGAAPGDAASAMPRDAAGAGSTATLVAPVPVPPAPARRVRGWVLCDYFADPRGAIVPLLLELNMHGRVAGEEGWP